MCCNVRYSIQDEYAADNSSGTGKTYQQVLLGRAISGIGSAGKIALTSVVVAGTCRRRAVRGPRD